MHICFLDIDGTLLLTGGAGQFAFGKTLSEEFGISVLNSTIPFAGRSDRAIATDLFSSHDIEPTEENWQRFYVSYLARLQAALHSHQGYVLPGVGSLLKALAARGDVALGLLTGNVREGARRKLVHYDLWHWFPFGGFGDEHADRCDIAAAAMVAAKAHCNGHTNGDCGQILVIGDTQHDIRCGRSIGARCVAVPTGSTSADVLRHHQPDVFVETLEDAAPILALFDV